LKEVDAIDNPRLFADPTRLTMVLRYIQRLSRTRRSRSMLLYVLHAWAVWQVFDTRHRPR